MMAAWTVTANSNKGDKACVMLSCVCTALYASVLPCSMRPVHVYVYVCGGR